MSRSSKGFLILLTLLASLGAGARVEPLWPDDYERMREYATFFEDAPYAFGARLPNSEDCSSFVQKVFGSAGIELPRSSLEQSRDKRFLDVPVEDLQAGDLVFFRNTWRRGVSHVAFMLDETTMIHSSPRHKKVHRSLLSPRHPLWKKIHSVRRWAPTVENRIRRPRFSWDEEL